MPIRQLSMTISIHAPRVGSDYDLQSSAFYDVDFNPRSPCGERPQTARCLAHPYYFNPRSPCGERRVALKRLNQRCRISIHAPRVGSDDTLSNIYGEAGEFQSTLPVWGATMTDVQNAFQGFAFQSTLPVWGATLRHSQRPDLAVISIHAPRVGSDLPLPSTARTRSNFNPRSPCGERR